MRSRQKTRISPNDLIRRQTLYKTKRGSFLLWMRDSESQTISTDVPSTTTTEPAMNSSQEEDKTLSQRTWFQDLFQYPPGNWSITTLSPDGVQCSYSCYHQIKRPLSQQHMRYYRTFYKQPECSQATAQKALWRSDGYSSNRYDWPDQETRWLIHLPQTRTMIYKQLTIISTRLHQHTRQEEGTDSSFKKTEQMHLSTSFSTISTKLLWLVKDILQWLFSFRRNCWTRW